MVFESNEMNKRNRVLLLTDIFGGMGGSERNIHQLLAGMDKKRFELSVACLHSVKLPENVKDPSVSIIHLKEEGIYTVGGLKNLVFLKRLVDKKQISLIVTYHESSDFYGLALSRLCRIPVISSRRDMSFKTRRRHSLAYRLVGNNFDSVIAVSDAVKKEVVRRHWFPEEKIVTIYNAIDVKEYGKMNDGNALKDKMGIDPNRPIVGVVANIRKIKGHQYFVHAASIIHKRNPNIEFLVVGYDMIRDGYSIGELKQYAEQVGISQELHFIGGRRDVADVISLFDVAVLTSLSEGFSNVILEYMASLKPVVATNVGGNPEIVVHGETGLLVPPADGDALAKAILSILEDKEVALRFGRAGRKRIEERFSVDVMLRNYENLFEQVINSRADRTPNVLT
jgi:glycosyltransferase involved in cell wall biosynthesis